MKTYEGLLAEGKNFNELMTSKEGIVELLEALQNSLKTKEVYLQPSELLDALVQEGKVIKTIKDGLTLYGLAEVNDGD